MEKFITTNEKWDISRRVDLGTTIFYLHGTTCIGYDELDVLQSYQEFMSIEIHEGCLCIRSSKI